MGIIKLSHRIDIVDIVHKNVNGYTPN
jgi:hypothetical protein